MSTYPATVWVHDPVHPSGGVAWAAEAEAEWRRLGLAPEAGRYTGSLWRHPNGVTIKVGAFGTIYVSWPAENEKMRTLTMPEMTPAHLVVAVVAAVVNEFPPFP